MAKYEGSVCLNHPDVPASFRCAVCGKPICSECAIKDGGMTYCSQQCRADAIRTGAMVDAVTAKKNAGKARRAIIRLIWLVILVAVAVAAYCFRDEIKSFWNKNASNQVENIVNQAEKAVKDAKKTVEDSTVNRQSKYKKDRENLVK